MAWVTRGLAVLGCALASVACVVAEDAPPAYAWSLPPGAAPPPVPDANPMTAEKVELGRHLFYELRLSLNEDRACGTCHEQAKGFTDGFHRAVGTQLDLHGHNTPSLVNVGYRTQLGWATPGAYALEDQLLVPLLGDDPIEMGMGGREDELLAMLADDPIYAELFLAAFPEADEPVSLDHLRLAIASFERTIISLDAPFDRYLAGTIDADALGAEALAGWELFASPELRCARCHGGRDFASPTDAAGEVTAEAGYFNVGLYDLDGAGAYPDTAQGLIEVTGAPEDMGRFRTPSLRNLAYTGPYMHDGSVISLEDAVAFMAAGGRDVASGPFVGDGRQNPHRSELLASVELDDGQIADLVAFLLALSDPGSIDDPALASPFAEATLGPAR